MNAASEFSPSRVSIIVAPDDHPPDLRLWYDALDGQTLPADLYEVVVDAVHHGRLKA